MNALVIEGTKSTPKIVLNKEEGTFLFSGHSLPEDAMGFYTPVKDWLAKYFADPNPSTTLTFQMEYMNTASSKVLFDIICMLREPHSKEMYVKVNWCYQEEDEDTLESGQDYASLVKVPFDFTVIS